MWDEHFESLLRPHLPYLPAQAPLDAAADLRDLGLDSMGRVELLAVLERHYQVRFVDDALTGDTFATAASLWERLSLVKVAAG
jgi:acyl carrier protein